MAVKNGAGFKVLDAISVVSKKLSGSELKIKRTKEFTQAEEKLVSYFGITSGGVWMLCAIISHYFDNGGDNSNFNDISSFFDCPVMSVVSYNDDIEKLLAKGYIRNKYGLDEKEIDLRNEFELSPELIDCILHDKKLALSKKKEDGDSITSLVSKMGKTVENQDFCTNKESKIADIEKKFKCNVFFSQILHLVPGYERENLNERMFFYEVCSDFLRGYDSSLDRTIDDSYDCSDDMKFRIANSFLTESHILLKADLLEFTEKGCLTDSKLTLTTKAKELLLGENARMSRKGASPRPRTPCRTSSLRRWRNLTASWSARPTLRTTLTRPLNVASCSRYNSRFPRLMPRRKSGVPSSTGSTMTQSRLSRGTTT